QQLHLPGDSMKLKMDSADFSIALSVIIFIFPPEDYLELPEVPIPVNYGDLVDRRLPRARDTTFPDDMGEIRLHRLVRRAFHRCPLLFVLTQDSATTKPEDDPLVLRDPAVPGQQIRHETSPLSSTKKIYWGTRTGRVPRL